MVIIYRIGHWELIDAPQDPYDAWELADRLTEETGIPHHVGRI